MKIKTRGFLVHPGTKVKHGEQPTVVKPFSKSKDEQRQRYMQACEACLSATSTTAAPWFVVPADDKEKARLIVSHLKGAS